MHQPDRIVDIRFVLRHPSVECRWARSIHRPAPSEIQAVRVEVVLEEELVDKAREGPMVCDRFDDLHLERIRNDIHLEHHKVVGPDSRLEEL